MNSNAGAIARNGIGPSDINLLHELGIVFLLQVVKSCIARRILYTNVYTLWYTQGL
jgi:hypothetical protein